VSDEAAEWEFSHGIEDAREPLRLPANEAIGARPRLCNALRSHDAGGARAAAPALGAVAVARAVRGGAAA
jgi:hypothetical protein